MAKRRPPMYPKGQLTRAVTNTIIVEMKPEFGASVLETAVMTKLPKARPSTIQATLVRLAKRGIIKSLPPCTVTGDLMYRYTTNDKPKPFVQEEKEVETFSMWDIGRGVVEYIELLKSEIKRLENEVRALQKQRNDLQEVCNNMKQEKGLPVNEIMGR